MNLHPTNAARLEACREQRAEAEIEARKQVGRRGCLFSRAVEFVGVNAAGDKVTEGGCWTWDRTGAGFDRDVARIAAQMPDVATIYLEGGFDYSDSPRAYHDGDYEPWVTCWSVEAWKR